MSGGTNEKSDKAERLLNLTLALLNTKIPLTKQQIFQNVAGYSGKAEAMERMFERDKDELREIGIVIQVLPIDLLFDDELGYRILPSEYFLPDISLSHQESIWLSVAANLIRESQSEGLAQKAFQKLLARSSASLDEILELNSSYQFEMKLNEILLEIWRAIRERGNIQFSYVSYDAQEILRERTVSPYLITSKFSNWYLVALDLQDRRLKTYRIDKIEKVIRSNDSEYISSDFESDIEPLLEKFRGDLIKKIIIRADAQLTEAHRLIRKASSVEKIDGSLLLTFYNVDSHEITEMILWSGSLVEVISPNFLRESIYQALTRTFQANT